VQTVQGPEAQSPESAIRGSADRVDAYREIDGPEAADTVTDFELVVDDTIAAAYTIGILKLECTVGGDDTNAKDQCTELHIIIASPKARQ
jgi:hypothetical protein